MWAPRLITVVMPMRNERRHVASQLAALAGQTYAGEWELVVVDNGSTDGSAGIVRSFAGRVPRLRIVDASPRGLNVARNAGVAVAAGDAVAFCDADDVADPQWLEGLAAALAGGADLVGGRLDLDRLNGATQRAWRRKRAWTEKRLENGFLEYVPGGNCAMPTALARELAWDEGFGFGSSDAEFSWRAQHRALRIVPAYEAVMCVRYPETIRELARQFYGYGAGEPLLFRRERARGWPRSSVVAAARDYLRLLVRLGDLVRSPEHRGRWVRDAAFRAGRVAGSLRHRVLYP